MEEFPGNFHRRPAFTGRVIVRTWRGKLIAQSWPRKATEAEKAKAKVQRDWFTHANWMAKRVDPEQLRIAHRESQGTPLYPRDLIVSAMAGRAFHIEETGVGIWYPVRLMTEVSRALDILGQFPGMILVRDDQGWVGLLEGEPGQVLTTPGDGSAPLWTDAGAGGEEWTLILDHEITETTPEIVLNLDPGTSEVRILARDVTLTQSAQRCIQWSHDGGATWEDDTAAYRYTTDGQASWTTPSQPVIFAHSGAVVTPRSFLLNLSPLHLNAPKAFGPDQRGRMYNPQEPSPINAVRIIPANSSQVGVGNMNGGHLFAWSR